MRANSIGVYCNHLTHNLDHLVPLCDLMHIPILCTEESVKEAIQFFYPNMQVIVNEGLENTLELPYSTLFYIDHARKEGGSFLFNQHYFPGPARSVCALHGNSDKKRNLFWIEKFLDEDVTLVYGQHMLDFLDEKGVLSRMKKPPILTGNFRHEYYRKYQPFFDAQIDRFLFPKNGKKTILYAPTWTAPLRTNVWREDYSGFFDLYTHVLDNIPHDFQVIVKWHPDLIHHYYLEVEEIKQKYSECNNIIFLEEMPLIYPLLAHVDFYLGDYSSIGYDFLTFNRPLFFLTDGKRKPTHDKGVYLHQAGAAIDPHNASQLYALMRESDTYAQKRKEIYRYAFGEQKSLSALKQEIEEALR